MKANELKRIGISRDVTKVLIRKGFILPEKDTSGNYDYSKEEVRYLKRYMILREADLKQEEIRRIEAGEITLAEMLRERIAAICKAVDHLRESEALCRYLLEQDIAYEQLLEESDELYERHVLNSKEEL